MKFSHAPDLQLEQTQKVRSGGRRHRYLKLSWCCCPLLGVFAYPCLLLRPKYVRVAIYVVTSIAYQHETSPDHDLQFKQTHLYVLLSSLYTMDNELVPRYVRILCTHKDVYNS